MTAASGELLYGGETIRYQVQRSAARRTLGIEVHPDLRVVVRAPLDCAEEAIAERVRRRAGWIGRRLAEFRRYAPRTPPRRYVSGETHLYLGRQYRLKLAAGAVAGVALGRDRLVVTVAGEADPEGIRERARELLRRWYRERALDVFGEVFGEVLAGMLPRLRRPRAPRLIVREMQGRWGSLSPAGSMTLNVDLIRAPRPCIEYVVAHELCHLTHRDHDAAFYRLLGRTMPDWEARKARLERALL